MSSLVFFSPSDSESPDKSEWSGVDLSRLADKASLVTLRASARAAEAFRFLGIADIWKGECQSDVECIIYAITMYEVLFWKLHPRFLEKYILVRVLRQI